MISTAVPVPPEGGAGGFWGLSGGTADGDAAVAVGAGETLGDVDGPADAVGAGVGFPLPPGVDVGLPVTAGVGDAEGELLALGWRDGFGEPVGVSVVGDGVGSSLSVTVDGVGVGATVPLGDGLGVTVPLGVGDTVPLGVGEGVAVPPGVGVTVPLGVGEGVAVPLGVGVPGPPPGSWEATKANAAVTALP